jgi:hypothetical protein
MGRNDGPAKKKDGRHCSPDEGEFGDGLVFGAALEMAVDRKR